MSLFGGAPTSSLANSTPQQIGLISFSNKLVFDSGSTDRTCDIAREYGARVVQRSFDNYAAQRNAALCETESEWVLFIDADVRVNTDAIKRALNQAITEEVDLLSLAPRITCSCSSEWMVQPIIACLLAIGFPINKTNNPYEETAFAAGPFMLFRQSAYNSVGGHNKVAGEVVEDLALARLIKTSGYKLQFSLGLDSVRLGMYSNLKSLWEGWSKNWFIGLDRNVNKALFASLVVFWIFSLPWIIIPLAFFLCSLGLFSF